MYVVMYLLTGVPLLSAAGAGEGLSLKGAILSGCGRPLSVTAGGELSKHTSSPQGQHHNGAYTKQKSIRY